MRSTIDCFQLYLTPRSASILAMIASTSAREIGVGAPDAAGAEPAAGAAEPPDAAGDAAAAFDPKIAFTMLLKIPIECLLLPSDAAWLRHPSRDRAWTGLATRTRQRSAIQSFPRG